MQTTLPTTGSQSIPDLSRIAQDLQIRKVQVENVVHLLDEGNTIPFITRYRKERTGGLNEDVIRRIEDRVAESRRLMDRKQSILKSIETQGKLTDALREAIQIAETHKRLEDLYLPYKPKKSTLATQAREKGLEPLADAVWNRDEAVRDLANVVAAMLNPEKQLNTPEEIMAGVQHILAERIAETAEVRAPVRFALWDTASLVSHKAETVTEEQGKDFRDYFDFRESIRQIPPHRILAVNRGERENILKVKLEWDPQRVRSVASQNLPLTDHPHRDFIETVVTDALDRLLLPSLEREIRRELTEHAQENAVGIFARNLRSLLLQPPLRHKRVLAIDPGFKNGCKLAALDEQGEMLEERVIHPHSGEAKKATAILSLEEIIRKHQLTLVALGNGTGCRETEQILSDLLANFEARRRGEVPPPAPVIETPPPPPPVAVAPPAAPPATPPEGTPPTVEGSAPPAESVAPPAPVAPPPPPVVVVPTISLAGLPEPPEDIVYVIVNEAGASDYSAGTVAKEEFPNLDAMTRGTISIGRRLQDPLAELVKIDPQHIGVGLYQHDVKPKNLKESLENVIESCVNEVGVDLNTASVPLLRHVAGMNQLVARDLVEFRRTNGAFHNREQLKGVPGIGEARFTQAAGFLKVSGGDEPLDDTWIHPESYGVARQVLAELGFIPADLRDKAKLEQLREKLKSVDPVDISNRMGAGELTVRDILDNLGRPGRDPREDRPPPIFKKGILKLEDLVPGMELKGTVLNVVPFGAFVDIGLKDTGLVHISQMANRYIKNPYEVVSVGDVVKIWVLTVDKERRRASLTLIAPGAERKPEGGHRPEGGRFEGRPQAPRGDRPQGDRPQGDRPPRPAHGTHAGAPTGGGPPRGPRPGGGPPRGPRPGGGGPPRSPRPGGPPRGDRPPGEGAAPPPKPAPPQPPKKVYKPKPLPKLSSDAIKGKSPLHTFGELEAFFRAREEPPAPPAPVDPPASAEPPPPAPPQNEGPPPAPELKPETPPENPGG